MITVPIYWCCPSLILRSILESLLPATSSSGVGSGTVRHATQRTVARAGFGRLSGALVTFMSHQSSNKGNIT